MLLLHFLFQLGLSFEGEQVLSALPDIFSQHFFNCCFLIKLQGFIKQVIINLWHQKPINELLCVDDVFVQQKVYDFLIISQSEMQSFKGLIPKNLTSDEAMGILTKRTEQFRKMTHQSSDIASSILKIYETYLLQLPRIMGLLFNDQLVDSDPFYSQLRSTYLQIYKEQQNFTLDHIQTPTNQITNSNSSRYINFSGSILTFQKLIKNYCSLESTALEMGKKYFKSQKALSSSIQAYKQSFTEAKLIYNIDEKIKRYSVCQLNYKNVAQDHGSVTQLKEKLEQKKKQVIQLFQTIAKQEAFHQNEVDIKIFSFLSKFNFSLYQSLKKRLSLSKQGKQQLEKVKITTFFGNFSLDEGQTESNSQYPQGRGRRKAGNISMLSKSQPVNSGQQLKKIYAKIEKFVEIKKNQHLKLYDFHQEYYKTAEKKCITQFKQALQNLEKNQKKIKQQFSKQTYEELKNTQILIKNANDIYTEFQKKIGIKILSASEIVEEMKNLLKNLLQQVGTITQKGSDLKQPAQNQNLKEKINNIQEILKTYDLRLSTIFSDLKLIYTQIISIYEIGLSDSYEKCSEIGKNSLVMHDQTISLIRQLKPEKLKNSPLAELLNPDLSGKIVFEDDSQKNNDFKKLKKPAEIKIVDKRQSSTAEKQKQQVEKEQCMNDAEERLEGSPSKKWKKHLDFIQSKISFVEGEQFKNTFSCALADKIILQGRLYVTNHRICFFSNFNPSNVFFGETFIQIPKKDILTLEKRKNGIFFDNSISITTVKGELFLTSFFKRNEAFVLISQIIGINREDQAYEEDPNALESDSSSVAQKLKILQTPMDLIKEAQKIGQVEAEDDIKQSQIAQRVELIQKMMDELTYPFKQSAIGQFKFAGLTAYKVLQLFILDGEVTISGKKFPNINQYFKKVVQLHKDVEISSFSPAIKEHLNPCNIKSTCPLKFSRRISAHVPTPNSGIPFVPKFTKASEKQSLYIISKHKWVLDNQVESSGAPYTDSFRVYYRTICDSTSDSCKVVTKLYIHFLKSVMVKNIIQSKTTEQSSLQFKKQYEEIRKYLASEEKQRAKRQKLLSIPELQSHQSCPEKFQLEKREAEDQKQRVAQLEEVIAEMKEKQELMEKQLREQVKKYKKISIGLAIFCILLLLGLSF